MIIILHELFSFNIETAVPFLNATFLISPLYAFRIKKEYLGSRSRQSGGPYISGIFDRPPCSPRASSKVTMAVNGKAFLDGFRVPVFLICTCQDWALFSFSNVCA